MDWEDDRRFEEIDSESDEDGHGVGIDGKFRGDELHFTGADLGKRSKHMKEHELSDSDNTSDSNEESDYERNRDLQVALRGKEDLLVEKALQRIRRAQELGKTNVRLSQSELDALQRKRNLDLERETRSKAKGRQKGASKKPVKREKTREQTRDVQPSRYDGESSSSSRRPPGVLVPSNTGFPFYAPLGYRPPAALPAPKTSRSGSRVPSSQNLARGSPTLSHRSGEKRNSTAPSPRPKSSNASIRSLPDDPNWEPRSRPSSSSYTNLPYPLDPNNPYNYQTYSPPLPQMPPQYANQSRRVVSTPQPDMRDRLPRYEGLGIRQPRREHSAPESQRESAREESENSTDDSDDDDDDEGVQVDVVPASNGRGYEIRTVGEGSARERRGGRR